MNIRHWAVATLAMAGAACAQISPVFAQSVEPYRIDVAAGYAIAGEITYPDHVSGPAPAVVLISGSGPQDRHAGLPGTEYSAHRQWVEHFTAAGFAVATFDETGIGESGGNWIDMSLTEHRDNVTSVVHHVRAQSAIDAGQVYALGHSEGRLVISMLSQIDPGLAGLIYAAPPGAPLRDVVEYQIEEMAQAQAETPDQLLEARAAVRAQFLGQIEGVASLREGLEHDPLALARAVGSPALVVQGQHDWQVRAEQAVALSDALEESGQPVEMPIFPDVNHLLVHDATHAQDYSTLTDLNLDPRLTASVVSWLTRQYANR